MPLPLAPLGLLYGAVVGARLRLYRSGLLKTVDVGAPVIRVGNVPAGGPGQPARVVRVARATATSRRSTRPRRGAADASCRAVACASLRAVSRAPTVSSSPAPNSPATSNTYAPKPCD